MSLKKLVESTNRKLKENSELEDQLAKIDAIYNTTKEEIEGYIDSPVKEAQLQQVENERKNLKQQVINVHNTGSTGGAGQLARSMDGTFKRF